MMKKMDLKWPSVGHVIEQTAREFKNKPLFIFEGKKLSFDEVNAQANQTANALGELGIGKGDRSPPIVVAVPVDTNILHCVGYDLLDKGDKTSHCFRKDVANGVADTDLPGSAADCCLIKPPKVFWPGPGGVLGNVHNLEIIINSIAHRLLS